MRKFCEGDVVTHKVGGPMMTVEGVRIDGLVATVWIVDAGHVNRDTFSPSALLKWRIVKEDE